MLGLLGGSDRNETTGYAKASVETYSMLNGRLTHNDDTGKPDGGHVVNARADHDPDRRNVYVECTYTYFAGGNSGIRRVARNIANNGPNVSTPDTVIQPVVWAGIGFFSPGKPLAEKPHPAYRAYVFFRRSASRMLGTVTASLSFIARPLPDAIRVPLRDFARRVFWSMRRGTDSNFLYCVLGLFAFPVQFVLGRQVRLGPMDTIVLMDSTWNSKRMCDFLIERRSTHDLLLGVMIHDLFPLTLPETCHEATVSGYHSWFRGISGYVDYFVTNSEATRRELCEYLHAHPEVRPFKFPSSSFTLGAELDLSSEESPNISAEELWSAPGVAITSVGTIEPRKNHEFLLDAFDELIERDVDVTLFIVGRIGWKSEQVVDRIESHPELGYRLHLLTDANDADLRQVFYRADCMVCCSIAEGFGLPVVEGLSHGLHVFASDIPVFREVGGDACSYFSLESPGELADNLEQWAEAYSRGEHEFDPIDWPDWEESTRSFRDAVRDLLPRAEIR